MKFIASLIIIYFVFRLFSFVFIRLLAHKVKKSGMPGNEGTGETNTKNKKKIINKDEGDYVDFEEIDKKNHEQ